jgi:DNA-binding YbaB/EbfC family protein
MFDQFKNLASLMKNAGAIRERIEKFKDELQHMTVEGESGGGAVRVKLNGSGKCLLVDLNEPLIAGLGGDDNTMIEELIASAFNNANEKLQELIQEQMQKAAMEAGLPPGMEKMIGQDGGI